MIIKMDMYCKINKRNKLQKKEIKIKVQGVQMKKKGVRITKQKTDLGQNRPKCIGPHEINLGH